MNATLNEINANSAITLNDTDHLKALYRYTTILNVILYVEID